MQEGRATTANNGANTYPIEALDQETPSRRFLGRVVLVIAVDGIYGIHRLAPVYV
jgi:hypothetical protein